MFNKVPLRSSKGLLMRKTKKIAVAVFLGIPLVCCLGGTIAYYAFGSAANSRLQEHIKEAHRIGMPVEERDLPTRQVTRSENAEEIYTRMGALISGNKAAESLLKDLSNGLGTRASLAELEKAREAYPKLKPLYDLCRRATDRPFFNKPVTLDHFSSKEFPHFRYMRQVAKLYAYAMIRAAEDHDYPAVEDCIKRGYRAADHAGQQPLFIGMLVRIASSAVIDTTIERLLQHQSDNISLISAIENGLKSRPVTPDMRACLATELVSQRLMIQQMTTFRMNAVDPSDSAESKAPPLIEKIVLAGTTKKAMEETLVDAYLSVWPDLPVDPEEWQKTELAMVKLDRHFNSGGNILDQLVSVFTPLYRQAALAIGRYQTTSRLLSTGIELIHMKQRSGNFPDRLPTSKLTIDPFSNKPLIYKTKGKGFVLYSVGADRKDDGGISRLENPMTGIDRTSDEVLKVE